MGDGGDYREGGGGGSGRELQAEHGRMLAGFKRVGWGGLTCRCEGCRCEVNKGKLGRYLSFEGDAEASRGEM